MVQPTLRTRSSPPIRKKHHASNYRGHHGVRVPTRNRGKCERPALCSARATPEHRQLNADLAHSRRLPPDRRRARNQRAVPNQTGGSSAASVLGLRFVLKHLPDAAGLALCPSPGASCRPGPSRKPRPASSLGDSRFVGIRLRGHRKPHGYAALGLRTRRAFYATRVPGIPHSQCDNGSGTRAFNGHKR